MIEWSAANREIAEVCQQAENQSAGVMCGILDQYASVFAKEGTAILLDCLSLTHVEVRIPSDIRIVAVKPGADVMSIDANTPPTGVLTPVVFAEGTASTVREVWVVALLTSATNDPKTVCDVVFTCQGHPTTSNIFRGNSYCSSGKACFLRKFIYTK